MFTDSTNLTNGILIDQPILQNGSLVNKNGLIKVTKNLLQNGGVHLSNGSFPGNNKVTPISENNLNNGKHPVKSMFNEVDG